MNQGSGIKVIYVAGPFRAATHWEIEQNIRCAEAIALDLWRLGGVAVLCPHTNTRFFHGAAPDAVWLDGCLELLRRCDAIFMSGGWGASVGACLELQEAERCGIKACFDLDGVKQWLKETA